MPLFDDELILNTAFKLFIESNKIKFFESEDNSYLLGIYIEIKL